MDAAPPPPPGGGGGGGSDEGRAPRGKGDAAEASGSAVPGADANGVVPVFGGDTYTQLFMLILLLLGLFKARCAMRPAP
jgi:hypothetical protein